MDDIWLADAEERSANAPTREVVINEEYIVVEGLEGVEARGQTVDRRQR